jgi:hypothetical protein
MSTENSSSQVVPILFRAFTTLVTVLISVGVAAEMGDSTQGKIWSAVLIAFVIALVEGLLYWAPKHSALIRRLLDPRSAVIGIWIQDVQHVSHPGWSSSEPPTLRFGVFWVEYEPSQGYEVAGFAYHANGEERSRWWSDGPAWFTADGQSMTYRWQGTVMKGIDPNDPTIRTGIATINIRNNIGKVEHVGMNLSMIINVQRVDDKWLREMGLEQFVGKPLKEHSVRNRFALSFAATLPEAAQ